jgi:hypothetical protein
LLDLLRFHSERCESERIKEFLMKERRDVKRVSERKGRNKKKGVRKIYISYNSL